MRFGSPRLRELEWTEAHITAANAGQSSRKTLEDGVPGQGALTSGLESGESDPDLEFSFFGSSVTRLTGVSPNGGLVHMLPPTPTPGSG